MAAISLLMILLLPLPIGVGLQWMVRAETALGRTGLAMVATTAPMLLIVYGSSHSDGISSAGTIALLPLIFFVWLVAAGIGVHLGEKLKEKK